MFFRRLSISLMVLSSIFFQSCGDDCVDHQEKGLSFSVSDSEDQTGNSLYEIGKLTNTSVHPNYGLNQYRKDEKNPIFRVIQKKDGELYTGCISSNFEKERTLCHYENGLPTLYEHYRTNLTTGDEHLLDKVEFKDGVPHGRWFRKVFIEKDSDDWMENPILVNEGFHNNGLVDGDWKEFQYQHGTYETRLKENWKFDKGERIGKWVQNNYVGKLSDFKEGETSSSKETTFYRNQILTETSYRENGKFSSIKVWGYYEPWNRHQVIHNLESSKFPDYDGSGKHDILDKYIEEGKSQIDKMLVDNNLPE
jgi:hypothetical protein